MPHERASPPSPGGPSWSVGAGSMMAKERALVKVPATWRRESRSGRRRGGAGVRGTLAREHGSRAWSRRRDVSIADTGARGDRLTTSKGTVRGQGGTRGPGQVASGRAAARAAARWTSSRRRREGERAGRLHRVARRQDVRVRGDVRLRRGRGVDRRRPRQRAQARRPLSGHLWSQGRPAAAPRASRIAGLAGHVLCPRPRRRGPRRARGADPGGRPGRLDLVAGLLEYVRGHEGVWVATAREVAAAADAVLPP